MCNNYLYKRITCRSNLTLSHRVDATVQVGTLSERINTTYSSLILLGIDCKDRLFIWGLDDRGQLGRATSNQQQKLVNSPQESVVWIPREVTTKLVACGWSSTIAVASSKDKSDRVFSWGSNEYCQLGRSQNAVDTATEIVHLPLRLHVASIACGWKHSLLATIDGDVFAWGTGRHGQLGFGDATLKSEVPKRIEALNGTAITHVLCGLEHSVFRSCNSEIFTCGNNRHGQLGSSIASENLERQGYNLPVRVTDPRDSSQSLRAVHVDCGWHFVMCLLKTGELVTWGKGSHGQLGLGGVENAREPKIVPFSHPIRQITCGSEHTMVLTTCGDLYTCGWGEHGNLGHGDKANQLLLKRVVYFSNLRQDVISIAAGGAVSIAVTSSIRTCLN